MSGTDAHELLVRSRAAQGLPATLEDDAVVERIAALLRSNANGADPKTSADARTKPRPPRRGKDRRG